MIAQSGVKGTLRCGFTLVEMLVTLSLLVVLILVSMSWVTNISRRQDQDLHRSNWQRAAYMVLDQFERDLMQVDMLDEMRRLGNPRVKIEPDDITIRTIELGHLVSVKYRFDQARQQLMRQADSSHDTKTPLLGDVERFHVELLMPDEQHTLPELHLTIESLNGHRSSRVLTLTREAVQQ
ncbi:MAG: hypothetical protein CMJ35_11700 [Phycisphaerae bacterium]|nr:hypothetical protein [Phycisphaerae bacterium]MBM92258.1 hypothetical protein [Phycisphaerae bacterium]